MFSNKKEEQVQRQVQKPVQKKDQIDTVIGPGTKFEGEISALGIIRIDGFFNGNLKTESDIIIGEQGEAEGVLTANNMIVSGKTGAKLICENKLEIKTNGKVIGDIEVNKIVIEENAIFIGQCYMRTGEESSNREKKNSLEKTAEEQKAQNLEKPNNEQKIASNLEMDINKGAAINNKAESDKRSDYNIKNGQSGRDKN